MTTTAFSYWLSEHWASNIELKEGHNFFIKHAPTLNIWQLIERRSNNNRCKTCVINDPVGQTHSPTSSDHYFQATFVLFFDILRSEDGRMAGNMCKNNDHFRPGLLVGWVDQKKALVVFKRSVEAQQWNFSSSLCLEKVSPQLQMRKR